ncbi:hypothetical protein [Sharpea azabuensis]|jgi:hypothetical protein|uniref:hypothetical protein n=1 Tax=Sharpea azabuensis TaxID=322505 RepID=UPI002E8231CE|nr:hypothetical protein [Sharpea azabuensis]MEE3309451.1 hypothetical protein [Sharpea azabuensis]
MYTVNGTTITLTRGDTFRAIITIYDAQGNEYTPESEDVVRFALKRTVEDRTPLILKTIDNETMLLEIEPNDTKQLSFGSYIYDIEITLEDGTVDTFIANAKLNLTVEVH